MSVKCAYCSREAQLTREHVVPNFIYKQNPQAKFGYNPKADQFVLAEIQIKDVCAICNNEHLGKLDAYASQFYEQNEIGHFVTNEKKMRLAYDYALLSRFLLKVTFNCMRFKGDDTAWIKPFSDYILYGVDHQVDLTSDSALRYPAATKSRRRIDVYSLPKPEHGNISHPIAFAWDRCVVFQTGLCWHATSS